MNRFSGRQFACSETRAACWHKKIRNGTETRNAKWPTRKVAKHEVAKRKVWQPWLPASLKRVTESDEPEANLQDWRQELAAARWRRLGPELHGGAKVQLSLCLNRHLIVLGCCCCCCCLGIRNGFKSRRVVCYDLASPDSHVQISCVRSNTHIIRSKHRKGSKERLFIMTRTHTLKIFRGIPFVKPQNDT